MSESKPSHVKVLLQVETDDGTVESESVWAVPVRNGYKIDNIPFYAREVAYQDVVSGKTDESGAIHHTGVVVASGHSTIRLWFVNESYVAEVRRHLLAMGCSSELDLPRLVAVDVPPSVPYSHVREYLAAQESAGLLEYEEACLGQE